MGKLRFRTAVRTYVSAGRRVLYACDRLGRHTALASFLLAAAVFGARVALLPQRPAPVPAVHDEFSYLLGGDTYASGRLTNPPHPHWEFFEAVHVLSQPTYAPKYPPGQALSLAMGQRAFGHPFYGVVLSNSFFVAALFWMLKAWAPPGFSLISAVQVGVVLVGGHYWMESYLGGCIAAGAACLVLGGCKRLARESAMGAAAAVGAGLTLLFVTRPYEGGVFVIGTVIGFLLFGSIQRRDAAAWARAALPLLAVAGAGALWPAAHNYAVTGNPLQLPYLLHAKQYDISPVMWVLPLYPEKQYRYPEIRGVHRGRECDNYRRARGMPLLAHILGTAGGFVLVLWSFVGWEAAALPMIAALRRDNGFRVLLLPVGLGAAALALLVYPEAHYMAPLMAAGLAVVTRILWRLRRTSLEAAAYTLILVSFTLGLVKAAHRQPSIAKLTSAAGAQNAIDVARPRIVSELRRAGGRHVVFVHYAENSPNGDEWVYNGANIDSGDIVWAHDRGADANRVLMDYYRGRRFWWFDPDRLPVKPAPLDAPGGTLNPVSRHTQRGDTIASKARTD